MTHMASIFNAFFYVITINHTIPNTYREVTYLQTNSYITADGTTVLIHFLSWSIYSFLLHFSAWCLLIKFQGQAPKAYLVCLFSILTWRTSILIYYPRLCQFFSYLQCWRCQWRNQFLIKTGHVCVLCLLGWALPPLAAVSFVTEMSVVLTYSI